MTTVVSIGRNMGITPMKYNKWQEFIRKTHRLVATGAGPVVFSGGGSGTYDGALEEAHVIIGAGHLNGLDLDVLSKLAVEYVQESIAVVEGDTLFVKQSPAAPIKRTNRQGPWLRADVKHR